MPDLHELQTQIIDATFDYSTPVGEVVARIRPDMEQTMLTAHGNPTATNEPAQYYDTLRLAEEALRRPMLRALGHLVINPVMQTALGNILYDEPIPVYNRSKLNHPPTFTAELSRGRVHNDERGRFVRQADMRLRALASLAFYSLGYMKQQDLFETFWDVSQRVRDLSAETLDHRLGKNWRLLDPADTALLKVKELDGRKLNRYDRKLLLSSQKPLSVHQSFGNATATAAEFTAIGIQSIHRALFKAGCRQRADWYPYSFAHFNKLSFGAKLPFWPAQDFAVAANSLYPPPLFVAKPNGAANYYSVDYAQTAHKNFVAQNSVGECQGIIPPNPSMLTAEDLMLRKRFLKSIRQTAAEIDPFVVPDMPLASEITSADAATALALSIAYKGNYNLVNF